MKWNLRVICVSLALTVGASLGFVYAQSQFPAVRELAPRQLEAPGPEALFPNVEAAAVDAFTYVYLGAVLRHVALYEGAKGARCTLKPVDVARFVTHPRHSDRCLNRKDESPSHVEPRGAPSKDPPAAAPVHPEVVCLTKGEDGPCLFAEAQGADYRISVNEGDYAFFLKSLSEDIVEPDAHHAARLSLYDGRHEEGFHSFIGGG
jgi:hypothetical protein